MAGRRCDDVPLEHVAATPEVGCHPLTARRPSGRAAKPRRGADRPRWLLPVTATDDEYAALKASSRGPVVAVWPNPRIDLFLVPPEPPLGTEAGVVQALGGVGNGGAGVLVVVVDTGFNLPYLRARGKTAAFDPTLSWSYNPNVVRPGAAPLGHGTMCAYDVVVAAPLATLADLVAVTSAGFGRLLVNALYAYRALGAAIEAGRVFGRYRGLVVTNSWGLCHEADDPGAYGNDPNHPFTQEVRGLEALGGDILFAAGNCSPVAPEPCCDGAPQPIRGANSSPAVLCLGGWQLDGTLYPRSSPGPGRLDPSKPDVVAFTRFAGSHWRPSDTGTSAACALAAGLVARRRSAVPYVPADPQTWPAQIRADVRAAARRPPNEPTFDPRRGFGVFVS